MEHRVCLYCMKIVTIWDTVKGGVGEEGHATDCPTQTGKV